MRKKKEQASIIIYAIIAVLVLTSSVLIYQWYQTHFGADYNKALQSELQDICATPPGYTDETWREHMSHHPDRYKECLK